MHSQCLAVGHHSKLLGLVLLESSDLTPFTFVSTFVSASIDLEGNITEELSNFIFS